MDIAEWIIVAILSATLFVFLIMGIVLIGKLFGLADEIKRTLHKTQDIADNVNAVAANVRGMTSIGGTIEMLVNKYINPKFNKDKDDESKGEDVKVNVKGRKKSNGGKDK